MKHSLRLEVLAKRMEQNSRDREDKSQRILEKLICLPEFKEAEVIAFYLPVNGEVDTLKMIKFAHSRGKEVCVPVVKEGGAMCLVVHEPSDELGKGKYGVPEPVGKPEKHHVDMVVVPGVVFDRAGHRIGMGKGYYDKYLKDKTCVNVGVCFDFQIVDKIPKDPHDIPMNLIISEKEVVKI